jgi:hypothetical protein
MIAAHPRAKLFGQNITTVHADSAGTYYHGRFPIRLNVNRTNTPAVSTKTEGSGTGKIVPLRGAPLSGRIMTFPPLPMVSVP